MGSGIGTAASVLIANAIGEKKNPGMYASQSLSFSFITSIVVGIIGYFISPFLFTLLGASD
jgi:Na+-driven multidrug efflux pump